MSLKAFELRNSVISNAVISPERYSVGEHDGSSEKSILEAGENILKSVNLDRMSQVHMKLSESDTRFAQNFRQGSHGR